MKSEIHDVLVVGSGIGGLTAARLLTEFGGRRVTIVEQHVVPGGMTHEFTRPGQRHFAVGVHYLGIGREGGAPQQLLDFLADGDLSWHLLPARYDQLHFPERTIGIATGEGALISALSEEFPDSSTDLHRHITEARRALRALVLLRIAGQLPQWLRSAARWLWRRSFPETLRTVRAHLSSSISNPALRAVLGARWQLYGPPPAQSAWAFHAVVGLMHYLDGAAYPVGGSRELGRAILDALDRRGVRVQCGQRVDQWVVEHGRCVGAVVTDLHSGQQREVRARTVVSDVGTLNTFGPLMPEPWRGRFARDLDQLRSAPSAVVLFLELDCSPAAIGLDGANHWLIPDADHDLGFERAPGDGALFVASGSSNNPAVDPTLGPHTIEVMSLVADPAFAKWLAGGEGHRDAEYRRTKDEIVSRLLQRLETWRPGFTAHLRHVELGTPLTFSRYQRSRGGGFYGLATTPERLTSDLVEPNTPISGLFLTGQDVLTPGIQGAVMGGVLAATAILPPHRKLSMWSQLPLRAGSNAPPIRPQWRGYLEVQEITSHGADLKTFRLGRASGSQLPFVFRGGQYLELTMEHDGRVLRRAYSISSSPSCRRWCEITVKREPRNGLSEWLHDTVSPGRALFIDGPHGTFTATWDGRPLVLIGGGVGMTPLLSVLREAADRRYEGRVCVIASVRTRDHAWFLRDAEALINRLPHGQLHLCMTAGSTETSDSHGRISAGLLAELVPPMARVHVCGPAPMMAEMRSLLLQMGVKADAIKSEAFVSLGDRDDVASRRRRPRSSQSFRIQAPGRQEFDCAADETVLNASVRAGTPLAHSCGEGICGDCRVRVQAGSLTADPRGLLTEAEVAHGWVLACQAVPTSDVVFA